MKRAAAGLVFLTFFGLYVASVPPSLAPWRDSGEMAASAYTLGVSHPTSYPLYVLLARAANSLPLGRPAYRDSLLSATLAALALAALFELCRRRWGALAGLGAALLLGLNGSFWSTALVQEMYSGWILCAVGLLWAALALREDDGERRWLFFCFAAGLALSNRLDVLLWAPGLLWLGLYKGSASGAARWAGLSLLAFPLGMIAFSVNWPMAALVALTAFWACEGRPRGRWLALGAAAGLAGLSAYAYLPLRSMTGPWLDWNHPAVLSNFIESVLRTRYGGTLDLLSKNYRPGECFGDNLAAYARHLWTNFSLIGLAAAAWGAWVCWRRDPQRGLGLAAAWLWSGPVFLAMANMPLNPHAAAIVEPHYLLSETALAVFAAEGLGDWAAASPALAVLACAALLAAPLLQGRWRQREMRERFFDYDFARNLARCAPPGAVVAAKKDIQLYTLWYFQTVQGLRPDLRFVSQGLAGSPWYQHDWLMRPDAPALLPLRDSDDWRRFGQANAPSFVTYDADFPADVASSPQGLLRAIAPAAGAEDGGRSLLSMAALRGDYDYGNQPDFFTSDLIDDYSQGWTRLGSSELFSGRRPQGEEDLRRGWALHWASPEAASFLGYEAFTRGDFSSARRYYGLEAALYGRLVRETVEYRSLPDLKRAMRQALAQALTHLGAACERSGHSGEARQAYQDALSAFPLAETHFNFAVLAWKSDKAAARRELEAALAVDPNYAQAKKYLALLGRP